MLSAQSLTDRISIHTLPNGIEVVLLRDTTLPLVQTEMSVRTGSLYEQRSEHGISHLWEHLFWDAGSDSLSHARQQRRSIGMFTRSWITADALQFAFTTGSDSLYPALEYFTRCITHPWFPPEGVEPARQYITHEIAESETNPSWFFEDDFRARFWGPTHRKQPLGAYFRMRNMDEEDISDFHLQWMQPQGMRLVIAGRFEEEELMQYLQTGLGNWNLPVDDSKRYAPWDTVNLTLPGATQWFVSVNEFAFQPLIRITWVGPDPGRDPEGYFAALVLATWMNHPANPMRRRLESGGLVAGFAADYTPGYGAGTFTITVSPVRDSLHNCLLVLLREVQKQVTPGTITREQWKMSCSQINRDLRLLAESPSAWAHFVSRAWGHGLPRPEFSHEVVQGMETDALDRLLRKYFAGKPLFCGALTNSVDELLLDMAGAEKTLEDERIAAALAAQTSDLAHTDPKAVEPSKADEAKLKMISAYETVRIRFEVNALLPEGPFVDTLAMVGAQMQKEQSLRFFINSYTDGEGDGVKNYLLSVKRAEAIRDYLVNQFGITPDRLEPRGYGEAFPEFNEKIRSEDAKNRRVTFTVKTQEDAG